MNGDFPGEIQTVGSGLPSMIFSEYGPAQNLKSLDSKNFRAVRNERA